MVASTSLAGHRDPRFDVVVIGAGHAGCEAALAAHRLGAKVALVTLDLNKIAQMSCNPAIGGVGKGHLVRELDVLGGAMAEAADATGIQYRTLNLSRGAAVRSTRCQSDSALYRQAMTEKVRSTEIVFFEDEAAAFDTKEGRLAGVRLKGGTTLMCRAAIVTTGTFLNGQCFVGAESFAGGRMGDAPASLLSASLIGLGLRLQRFKTGTTPRLDRETIAWDTLEAQPGHEPRPRFAFDTIENQLPQLPCHMTRTHGSTIEIIRENLDKSPLYRGVITGTGARYCPSLEDKVVRFADRVEHTIFLEPEGIDSPRVYPNGISTSLPKEAQDAFLRTIPGLEHAKVLQYGYAVEYDFAPPDQVEASLMTKVLPGLFLAGQINGTSGYEEAAAQGLIAGLNACRYVDGQAPVSFTRAEGYIGVLIDDLVTKGVDEPYRMFTSRAEHRLTLRESTAEKRLLHKSYQLGLIDEARYRRGEQRLVAAERLVENLQQTRAPQRLLNQLNIDDHAPSLADLIRRPDCTEAMIRPAFSSPDRFSDACWRSAIEALKYAGYIKREQQQIERLQSAEGTPLPPDVNYRGAPGLSRELQEKLSDVRPRTLGQASRIPGMTPAALALLKVQAHQWERQSQPTA